MPRYLVERTFSKALDSPFTERGVAAYLEVVNRNAELGVTWLHSYISDDHRTSFCLYEGPDPESIRKAADRNGLPLDRITRVSMLDPYFYRPL